MQRTKNLLNDTFKSLELGRISLTTFDAATDEAIDLMWSEIRRIDQTLTPNDTTKAKIRNKAQFFTGSFYTHENTIPVSNQ